jgi:AraC-like DNA-binding protein
MHEAPAPSALAPGLLRYLRARGHSPSPLAGRVGLSDADEEKDEVFLTPSALSELVEAVASELGEPFLGLRLASELPARRYAFAEMAIQSCPTGLEALESISRYVPLLHPDLQSTIAQGSNETLFVVTTPRKPRGVNRHVHEYALAFALFQLRRGGCDARVGRLFFSHARPPRLEPLFEFFRTQEVTFGEDRQGFILDTRTLLSPMSGRDAKMRATVEALAEESLTAQPRGRSFSSLAEEKLERLLSDGPTLVALADSLRMSPRTVQRRLEQEGTSFAEMLDRVREKLARAWLGADTRSLVEIGAALGFADLASFSRAFKRWTGKPPGMWRRSR